MGSQIDVQTGYQYADEVPSLSKPQPPPPQLHQQLKEPKRTQPSLLESIMRCNEIEEGDIADELITDHNDRQAINWKRNSGNVSDVRTQLPVDVPQMKLREPQVSENSRVISRGSRGSQNFAKNDQILLSTEKHNNYRCTKGAEHHHHPTCSQQISYCSVAFDVNEKRPTCQQHLNEDGVCCRGSNYNSRRSDVIHGKSKQDKVTQTSDSFNNPIAHCSKSVHQQVRSKSNFIKPN
ncbi:unnamed protein product, partial [Litomosoides sigmodontis]